MKRIILGILLSAAFGVAQAAVLEIKNSQAINFSGYNGQPAYYTGARSTGFWGSLFANTAGTFSATYLGNESGYRDGFLFFGVGKTLTEFNSIGQTISGSVGPGTVGFSFFDSKGGLFSNGQQQTKPLGFAILDGKTLRKGTFDYLLGFNDSYTGDADYDDYVVGVNFVAAPVPEPETYAMLLAGLGLIGFSARRRA
jgi:predicted outer membrane lipoprotein